MKQAGVPNVGELMQPSQCTNRNSRQEKGVGSQSSDGSPRVSGALCVAGRMEGVMRSGVGRKLLSKVGQRLERAVPDSSHFEV